MFIQNIFPRRPPAIGGISKYIPTNLCTPRKYWKHSLMKLPKIVFQSLRNLSKQMFSVNTKYRELQGKELLVLCTSGPTDKQDKELPSRKSFKTRNTKIESIKYWRCSNILIISSWRTVFSLTKVILSIWTLLWTTSLTISTRSLRRSKLTRRWSNSMLIKFSEDSTISICYLSHTEILSHRIFLLIGSNTNSS